MFKALVELGRLDLPASRIYHGSQAGYVDQMSCLNIVLLLLDWKMFLVLLLIGVGGGKVIKFYFFL